jgi:hypothetical protein
MYASFSSKMAMDAERRTPPLKTASLKNITMSKQSIDRRR